MTDGGMRRLANSRELKIGACIMEVTSPGIGQVLKAAGFDYAFIDTEHSGFGVETVKSLLRYCQAADLPAFVRPPSQDYADIARILDMGAEGVMPPMIGKAKQARAVARAMKYPPMGERGTALGIAHDRYVGGNAAQATREANENTVFLALIETAEGVENADAIAATQGVDVLWIGQSDLSASLGVPGDFAHPRFVEAEETIIAAARAHGRGLGRLVGSVEEGIAYRRRGFDFICYSTDFGLIRMAGRAGVAAIREADAKATPKAKPAKKSGAKTRTGKKGKK